MKKVLAFFGAFNPPTLAHLELAELAMKEAEEDGVVFVPSKSVYIKEQQGKDFAFGEEERLRMLREAAGNRPWMEVTDWELRQEQQPRTYETLCHLSSLGYQPTLLMGSDKLPELEHGWKHVPEIAREYGILCMTRGKDDLNRMLAEDPFLKVISAYIRIVETPRDRRDISSSQVRRLLARIRDLEEQVQSLVPPEIFPYLD